MATDKTSTLPYRNAPVPKEVRRMVADCEHSSIINMLEVLVREHCAWNEIRTPEEVPVFSGNDFLPTKS